MAAKSASAILASPAVQQRRAMARQPMQPMGGMPQAGGMATPGMAGGGGSLSGAMAGGVPVNRMQQPPAWGGAGGMTGGMKPAYGQQPPAWFPNRPGVSDMPGLPSYGAAGGGMPGQTTSYPGGGGPQTMDFRTSPETAGRVPGGGNPMGPGSPQPGGGGGPTMQTPRGGGPASGGPDAGGLYGGGMDPDYPGMPLDAKGKRKFKHYGAAGKLRKKGFDWMQDQGPYQQMMDTISQIMGRQGQMSPERMIQEQSSIEQGRGQGQQALSARMAQYGIDPSSPQAMSMMSGVDQSANRMQAENRRAQDLQAEQQMRSDLNLPLPALQAMLSMITKRGGGGVQALPMASGGGGGPDYASLLAQMGGQALQGWGQSGFKTGG